MRNSILSWIVTLDVLKYVSDDDLNIVSSVE